ncbi:hypothetical protein PAXRUDRAFT_763789 [Paxillus rubicundulus Ve08.2h10]|uniref:Unplaced genomic scaffold scaffold_1073, whole genome shotgun sequence n=1 Tax=Paxillus rubicundulus Ve08.2h10 TaxID=930991 RepID=A0A0D0DHN2_9AGAM|nr:hypothetical protein PAXRUDRAFT_763789 [Paxillus rubicundulus Ve08.2h10]
MAAAATQSDYYGLPSKPVSVYHTGASWKRPTSPEVQCVLKEARSICKHLIADVWDKLGPQIPKYLDSVKVKWSTIDVTHFAEVEKDAGPMFLWVGVKHGSLSRENAKVAAVGCKEHLEEFQIADVKVAFWESLFAQSVGPQLSNYVSSVHATADVCSPLTPALDLHIASRATPHFEGIGGVYICEGGENKRVFVLTARHVIFPPNTGHNEPYARKTASQPRHDVLLLGSKAFQDVLKSIMVRIRPQAILVDHYKDELEGLGEAGEAHVDDAQDKEQKKFKHLLQQAEEAINVLDKFHGEVMKNWSAESQRVLGHVAHSPPISVGTSPKCFTDNWALIELHREKIDWEAFKGNVIDLGTEISVDNFMLKMYSHPTARTSVKYPHGRLLQLQDFLNEDKLHHPKMLDTNGEACLLVIKNSNSTGVTIGRATGIMSFVREYFEDGTHETSMELAIYPYSNKGGAFSTPGDSDSIIADGKGCIVGLLTGGAGQIDSTDVTYTTPFYWLFDERIKVHFPNAYLYPYKACSPIGV